MTGGEVEGGRRWRVANSGDQRHDEQVSEELDDFAKLRARSKEWRASGGDEFSWAAENQRRRDREKKEEDVIGVRLKHPRLKHRVAPPPI